MKTRRATFRKELCQVAAVVAIAAGSVSPAVAGSSDSTYTQTVYPVVMVPGTFGFSKVLGLDYFYGIVDNLRAGGATVYSPALSPANSNEVRGEQLLAALRQLQAAYGYKKFNLIGHSQGAPTARYVAAVAPDLVASVSMVGGAQGPNPVADALVGLTTSTDPLAKWLVGLVNGIAGFLSSANGAPALPQDIAATAGSLTTVGSAAFNKKFPQGAPTTYCGTGPAVVNHIPYFSATGTAVATNGFDITDLVLVLSSTLYAGTPNDGLVSRCASHWGTVIKDDFAWNHLDEVNQVAGLRGLFSQDPVSFYRSQVNRLKGMGL